MEWRDFYDFSTFPGAMALAVLIFIVAWLSSRLLTKLLRKSSWVMGKMGRKVDPTVVHYTLRLKSFIIYLAALLFFASLVPPLRAFMGTLLAGAGITAVIAGFAAKSSLANLMSGLSIAIYRPIRIGDTVTMEGEYGYIEDVTLRHTIVKTWENKRLIIPNEKIDQMTIVNHSLVDPSILCRVEFGISYDTDIDLARRLVLEEAAKCPNLARDRDEPWVKVISHGDFSIGMRLYIWVPNQDEAWSARWYMLEAIKKRFDAEGVEIPFPYRTLVYKKDLPPARRPDHVEPTPSDGQKGT